MTQEQDSQGQARQSEAGDRPRVLLVDDAAAIRNAIRGVLEDAGIEVVGEAPDGVQGVAMAAHSAPTWC
jgi:chemotaxis response regulator CheB